MCRIEWVGYSNCVVILLIKVSFINNKFIVNGVIGFVENVVIVCMCVDGYVIFM